MLTNIFAVIGIVVVLAILFLAAAIDSFLLALVVIGVAVAAAVQKPEKFEFVTQWLPTTWYGIVALVVVWCLIGVLWSVFKFNSRFEKDLVQYMEYRRPDFEYSYKQDHPNGTPEEMEVAWKQDVKKHGPQVGQYSNRIPSWIALWPFSMINYVCTDLLHDVFHQIYLYFSEVYERIATRIRDRLLK
jgi:hypothetical protein